VEFLELTKPYQQHGHSIVRALQRRAYLDFKLVPIGQLGQRIAYGKFVGTLLCRDASYPFGSLVYDAADTEHNQRYADKIYE
jgi:hypothetical protein